MFTAKVGELLRSNRTFMELKCGSLSAWTAPRNVLIVPLWN